MSIRVAIAGLGLVALTAGCSSDADTVSSASVSVSSTSDPAESSSTSAAATDLPATQPTEVPSTSTAPTSAPMSSVDPATLPPDRRAAVLCARTGIGRAGQVAASTLDEASGLAASRTHPGVLWSHNDGGDLPGVFGIGPDGSDLGFHPLPIEVFDVEDMAIATGVNGDDLYLGDIGDNRESRRSITIVRFPEPDPKRPGPIPGVERFEFTYPDRAHNAETLLVDEATARIVVVTKEQGRGPDGAPNPLGATAVSFVFEGDLNAGGRSELVQVGSVDTLRLQERTVNTPPHPASVLGVGGIVTGGDVSPDGSLVALRTYEAVWVWARNDGQSVGEVFVTEPCQVTSFPEPQGEAVAFVGEELATLSEGVAQAIHRLGQ